MAGNPSEFSWSKMTNILLGPVVIVLVGTVAATLFFVTLFNVSLDLGLLLRWMGFTLSLGSGAGVFLSGWYFAVSHGFMAPAPPKEEPSIPSPEIRPIVNRTPTQGPRRFIVGRGGAQIPTVDLKKFITEAPLVGHAQNKWTMTQMPSGRTMDGDYWTDIINVLVDYGWLQGMAPRISGVLAFPNDDPNEALAQLGIV